MTDLHVAIPGLGCLAILHHEQCACATRFSEVERAGCSQSSCALAVFCCVCTDQRADVEPVAAAHPVLPRVGRGLLREPAGPAGQTSSAGAPSTSWPAPTPTTCSRHAPSLIWRLGALPGRHQPLPAADARQSHVEQELPARLSLRQGLSILVVVYPAKMPYNRRSCH